MISCGVEWRVDLGDVGVCEYITYSEPKVIYFKSIPCLWLLKIYCYISI